MEGDIESAVAADRERVVRVLEMHRADIQEPLLTRLISLVISGRDVSEPHDLPGY